MKIKLSKSDICKIIVEKTYKQLMKELEAIDDEIRKLKNFPPSKDLLKMFKEVNVSTWGDGKKVNLNLNMAISVDDLPPSVKNNVLRLKELEARRNHLWNKKNSMSKDSVLLRLANEDEEGRKILDKCFEIADDIVSEIVNG